MSRSGFGLRELADRTGIAHRTLLWFLRGAWDRNGIGLTVAQALLDYIAANPVPLPEVPGKLYETAATREMDKLLYYIARGHWGTLYGPAGAQKTFLLEYRAAELARRSDENPIVYIRTTASGMSPTVLLGYIGQALRAPWAQHAHGLLRSVLDVVRRRRSPVAIVIDEAQQLYSRIDTLETLRALGDLAGTRIGILVAGNEQVLRLFEPRKNIHFEQWRSRIDQKEVRVLGPSGVEARSMVLGEIPTASDRQIEAILAGCAVKDPISKHDYINVRRLFNALREIREARAQLN
jgi:type II secretory pathway predicted ATPase ExeA